MPPTRIGVKWPSVGLEKPNFLRIPLYATLVLVFSSFCLWRAKKAFLANRFNDFIFHLEQTILAGFYFLIIQLDEYTSLKFNFSDSVYGSLFYFTTGAHGLHVFIGLVLLFICWIRAKKRLIKVDHQLGFIIALGYWKFVDRVWICVYLFFYCNPHKWIQTQTWPTEFVNEYIFYKTLFSNLIAKIV